MLCSKPLVLFALFALPLLVSAVPADHAAAHPVRDLHARAADPKAVAAAAASASPSSSISTVIKVLTGTTVINPMTLPPPTDTVAVRKTVDLTTTVEKTVYATKTVEKTVDATTTAV